MLKLNCTIKWVMAIAITTYLGQATAGSNWLGPIGHDGISVINKIDCKSVGKIPKRDGKYLLVILAAFKGPILFSEKGMRQLRKKCESR